MEDVTLDALIDMGVYEVSGVDENGEPMYSLNVEVAKKEAPDVYWEDRNACETVIMDAVEAGYLEWDIDSEKMEMTYYVTELGEKFID